MTEEEERFVKRQYEKLPYMYLALLEYCSEVTGDSLDAIDDHIEQTVVLKQFSNMEKLNG
tara:strand:+ start:209 stop:388 length:180 start_codon:yes stop_codon:yes gene_type:complete